MVSLAEAKLEIEELQTKIADVELSAHDIRMIEATIIRIGNEVGGMTGSKDIKAAIHTINAFIWATRMAQAAYHALMMARALGGDPTALIYWAYFGATAVGAGLQVYDATRGF